LLVRFPRRPSLTLVGAVTLLIAIANPAASPPRDLDSSFAGGGIVTRDFADSTDEARGVAIQGDGKLVTAGVARIPGFGDFALARYKTDGSLDPTFSGDGLVTTDFGSSAEAFAVAIQGDGKIVAAGYASDADFALARYNTDGSLDPTFDGDGLVTTDFAGDFDRARAMVIQGDGKIVAAGWAVVPGPCCFALARYNTDGSLDTTFSGDGRVTTDFGADGAQAVALQADGKIVAGGFTVVTGTIDFALARYNSDGSLDTTFSGDGKVATNFTGDPDEARALAIQGDGKIVAAGGAGVFGIADFALARYKTDGSLDPSFGGDGKVRMDFAGGIDEASAMAIQGDGKIVAAGRVRVSVNNYDFALARYNTDGSLDPSFDVDGLVTTDFGGGPPTCAGRPATIIGTQAADTLTGTPQKDVIVGLEGKDSIRAGGGSDIVCAGSGNDNVAGGRGMDRLRGERGNDRLRGGSGADRLIGGLGRDRLIGGPGDDFCRQGPGSGPIISCESSPAGAGGGGGGGGWPDPIPSSSPSSP
jgi:uncharacterized delta-60 repeat protein